MTKFKFITEDEYQNTKIQHEFEAEYLNDVIFNFHMFLLGNGFVLDGLNVKNQDEQEAKGCCGTCHGSCHKQQEMFDEDPEKTKQLAEKLERLAKLLNKVVYEK